MRVSIIIPVYSVSAYIERSIKSVMNQTYSDIECIIVDDATPDDSILKCEQMIASYNGPIRFFILHHERNRGLSAARNTGTEAATGEYLYYLDSDDEMTPDCIETLLKPMIEDNTIEIIQGNHMDEKKGPPDQFYKGCSSLAVSGNQDVRKHYYKHHHICASAWNKLIKRSFVERNHLLFREGLLFEDRLWIFYVLKKLESTYICKDVTYYYHANPDSITSKIDVAAVGNSFCLLYDEILTHLTIGNECQELRGYVYGFCKPYCLYVKQVPALSDIFIVYQKQAIQYGCRDVGVVLFIVGIVNKFCSPIGVMEWLHTIRWKLVGQPDVFFNRTTK